MNKRLKHILKGVAWTTGSLFIFLILVVSIAAGVVYFKKDAIKNMLMTEMNKYLVAPIYIQNVDVGIIKSFPLVSVEFEGIQGMGLNRKDPEPMFKAENISLRFNLIDFLKSRFDIKEVMVEGGEFNLKRYKDLSNNYIIWKYNPEAKPISFQLKKVVSQNTLIRYRDLGSNFDVQFLSTNLHTKGELRASSQDFKIKGSYRLLRLIVEDTVYLKDFDGKLDLSLGHDLPKQCFFISKGKISVENLKLELLGKVFYDANEPSKNSLTFDIKGKNLEIEKLLHRLPNSFNTALSAYKMEGFLDLNLNIEGNYKFSDFDMALKYKCNKVKITHKESGISVHNLSANGMFCNGNLKDLPTFSLTCNSLSAEIAQYGKVAGNLSIKNFEQPTIKFDGRISGGIKEISSFFGLSDSDVKVEGQADLRINYSNTFSSFKIRSWSKDEIAGAYCDASLNLIDFYLDMPKSHPFTISADSVSMKFTAQTISLNPSTLKINDQELRARLHIENLLPYWLSPEENLYVSAGISASTINLEEWAYLLNNTESKPADTSEKRWTKNLLDHLYLDFSVKAGKVVDKRGPFNKVEAMVYYTPTSLQISDLKFNAYNGTLRGSILSEFGKNRPGMHVEMKGGVENIRIENIFESFDNFSQKQITSKNMKGLLSADFTLSFEVNSDAKVEPNSILFTSDINIKKGELIKMEALQKLAKFTGEADLSHIRFATLSNTIKIEKSAVYIPDMHVNSSLLSLDFTGVHKFDNMVDYKIDIELSELLSQRRKKRALEEELGLLVAGKEQLYLPLIVSGHISNPIIKYDFKASRIRAKKKYKKERESIREAFRKEAEYSRKNSLEKQENEQHRKQLKEQEKGKFIIETEDVDVSSSSKASAKKTPKKDSLQKATPFKVEWDE